MRRPLIPGAALAVVALLIGLSAPVRGEAATLYTDRASWEAAVGAFADVDIAGQVPEFAVLSAGDPLVLPLGGSLTFDIDVEGRQVPGSWATWSGGQTPAVLSTLGAGALTGSFSSLQSAFGFEAEPNPFQVFEMTLLLSDGSILQQLVDGDGGAAFFGWTGASVVAMSLTCADGCGSGFAIGRLVQAVPEPVTLLLLAVGLVGSGLFIRRRQLA